MKWSAFVGSVPDSKWKCEAPPGSNRTAHVIKPLRERLIVASLPKTTPLVYTGETTVLRDVEPRFPPATVTEELSQFYPVPDVAPYAVVVLLFIAVALIFGACYLVALVNTQAFAVLAAFLVAGFIWLAFGATGDIDVNDRRDQNG